MVPDVADDDLLRVVVPGEGDADGDDKRERTDEVVSLVCRRRDCEYKVVAVMPEAEERAVLEERLAALLWSGGES